MYHAETLNQKLKLFTVILWPILVTQVSMFGMNLIDTIMSGRAGAKDLAGVAVGSSIWMAILLGFSGVLMAVIPIVSHLAGGGHKEKVAGSVTQALYLSIIMAGIAVVLGLIFLNPFLSMMKLEPDVEYIARHYLIGITVGIFPILAVQVIRNFFDALGYTKWTMIIMLAALPLNAFLNYGLIFGRLGLPELGGIGAGYATAFTYWLILFISIGVTLRHKDLQTYQLFVKWFAPSYKVWKEQLSIGVPMGFSLFFEVSIFSAVTLLIGMMFDTATLAAHQAIFSFVSMVFMIPLSISLALTIMVGFALGGSRHADARQYTRLGVVSAVGIMAVSAVLLYVWREPIAYLYTENPKVAALAVQFMIFAIIHQISDAIQVAFQGVLRGYKDVKIPFVITLISYWGIGLPVGYLLASHTFLGPFGLWLGITIGLTCAAVGFVMRLRRVQRHYTEVKA
jgi:MATE family multidrug resistance protein